MAVGNVLLKVSVAMNAAALEFQQVTDAMNRLRDAFIFIDAPFKSGNWPDYFILVNRYLRTDALPTVIDGERWEA